MPVFRTPPKPLRLLQYVADLASGSPSQFTFSGVPASARRVVLLLRDVSGSASADLLVRIGAGAIDTTGYVASNGATAFTTGFVIEAALPAADSVSAVLELHRIDDFQGSGFWVLSGAARIGTGATSRNLSGRKGLAGNLDSVQLLLSTGTFDNAPFAQASLWVL